MTDSLRHRCELFVGNRDILKKNFKLDTVHILSLCAHLYATNKAIADPVSIKAHRKEIRKRAGFMSNFGWVSLVALSSASALDVESEKTLDRTFEIYEKLRRKVYSSCYLPLTSRILASLSDDDCELLCEKTVTIYNAIKKIYPRYRCGDDIVYAALLAVAKKDESDLLKSLAKCTEALSRTLSKPSLKQISMIITVSSSDAELCCKRFINLSRALGENSLSVDKNDKYTLSHIATLSTLKVPEEELIASLLEVYAYLKEQKGFGVFFGRTQRLVYSILQLYGEYVPINTKKADDGIKEEVKNDIISVSASVSTVICAEIAWALAAVSAI